MALTVENLCGLIIQSRLYSSDDVRAMYLRWKTVSTSPDSVPEFVRWLVGKGYLTTYQANLICNGQVHNFFFNEFKIVDRIGKGRMAGVYKAVGPRKRTVAIKVLPPSKAKDPETLGRFQREAQLAMQLNHPNVVRTFTFGVTNGLHFLVMEYLEGGTLDTLIQQRGKLPPKEAVRMAFLAALGLQHIHEQRMVHRDLKPGNVMLSPFPAPEENTLRSMVKILDIGLGRTLFDPKSRDAEDLTNDGVILGTPDYLAPEQARDPRRTDIRADIYSLGCTLYHALAGRPPFADDNLVRQILRHATQQPGPLCEANPDVSPDLDRVVMTMLAKDPAQRYPSPGQAALALKEVLAAEDRKLVRR